MAFLLMECGRRLLQEVYDARVQIRRISNEAVSKSVMINICSDFFTAIFLGYVMT